MARLLPVGLLLVLLAVAGCGGGDPTAVQGLVAPEEFERAVAEPRTVAINVHTPDEGSIEGTDLAIPFDRLEARKEELPATSTRLAVYCRSGSMSAEAVRTLARLGYRDVVELEGGMIAWERSGRPLLPSP
ncbi:MAG: rhodanese-like domain-containing protein [Gaiellaceae bacterium]